MAYTTINKAKEHFTPFTYTGTGSATTKTGVGFTPDLAWGKNTDVGQSWWSIDQIRGNSYYLPLNSTNMQNNDVGNFGITTDGLTFPNGDQFFNGSGHLHGSWLWKGAGSSSSNTDGTITANVNANPTAGFSIIDFTGTEASGSVGHGLGAEPSCFVMRRYTDDGYASTSEWYVYHKSVGGSNYLRFNGNNGQTTNDGTLWNTSTPVTSSVINIGSNANSNHSGNKTIIYAWVEKPGYSKFGKYTGNGGNQFIYTGFKPSFFLLKSYNQLVNWKLMDNKRDPHNPVEGTLNLNTQDVEDDNAAYAMDFVSNGVMLRNGNANMNQPGGSYSYVYMAFGQTLVGSNNVPCTAR